MTEEAKRTAEGDIVERLRNWESVDILDAHEDGALYNAAADEIERLREALSDIEKYELEGTTLDAWLYCAMRAKAALEGK